MSSEIPVVLMSGKYDILATPQDARWIRDQFKGKDGQKGPLVMYKEIKAGHGTFLIGENMDYWTTDILDLINEAHKPESKKIEML